MLSLDNFIKLYTNLVTDFDNAFGTQCMDLMHFYVYLCLGIYDKGVLAAPSARLAYTNKYPQYFTKIDNGPVNFPLKGDIIFWGSKLGPDGHVAIVVSADPMKLTSFDANFPVGTKPHLQAHDYFGVLGWLRPKIKGSENALDELIKLKAEFDKFKKETEENNEDRATKDAASTKHQELTQKAYSISTACLDQIRKVLEDARKKLVEIGR